MIIKKNVYVSLSKKIKCMCIKNIDSISISLILQILPIKIRTKPSLKKKQSKKNQRDFNFINSCSFLDRSTRSFSSSPGK